MRVLEMWSKVMTASVRSAAPDLSARQMALLLLIYLDKKPHTVRGLAVLLNISKPAVSRALDRLGIFGFIHRKRDDNDRRSVLVQKTDAGAAYLTNFGQLIEDARLS